MPIQVYTTSRLSDLAALLERVREQTDTPLVVLCRTSAIQTMLGHQLARDSYERVTDNRSIRLWTFNAWLDDLWVRYGDGRARVDQTRRRILIEEIIDEWSGELPGALKSLGGENLLEQVCEHAHQGIEKKTSHDPTISAIVAIASRYRDALQEADLIDTGGIVALLEKQHLLLPYELVLYGFSDLTSAQRHILRSIAASTYVHIVGFGIEGSPTYEDTLRMAYTLSDDVRVESDSQRVDRIHPRALESVALHAFTDRPAPAQRDATVSFRRAFGSAATLVSVIDEIETLRDADKTQRIAVVSGSRTEDSPLLIRELEKRAIPYSFDKELSLEATELGSAFLALLGMAQGELDAATIHRYTASLFSDYPMEEAAFFDTALRTSASFTEGGPRKVLARMAAWLAENTKTEGRILSDLRACVGGCSLEQWMTIVDRMLAQANDKGFASSYQHTVTMAVYRVIGHVLEELEAARHKRITASDIMIALRRETIQLNPTPGSRDVVFTSPERIDGLLFDAVILAGIDSASYQASTTLSNTERVLERVGIGRFHGQDEVAIEQSLARRNQFYEASLLQSATKHLCVIFQVADDEGQPRQPSGFLEEIVAQFQEPKESFSDAFDRLASSESLAWDSPQVQALIHDVVAVPIVGEVAIYEHGEQPLLNEAADSPISASQLELYAKCPYKWFIIYLVGLREFDRVLDARDSGSLVHDILFEAFTLMRDRDDRAITDTNLEAALRIADEVIARMEENDPHLLARDRPDEYVRALEYVRITLESEPELNARLDDLVRPLLFEYEIEREDGVIIGGAHLHGRIDRIDVSTSHYVVIDYKGSIASTVKLIDDRNIQAGIYLLALAQLANTSLADSLGGKEPGAALYKSYKRGTISAIADTSVFSMKPKSDALDPEGHEKFTAQLAQIEGIVRDVVVGMRDGNVRPPLGGPPTDYVCSTCPFLRCPQRRMGYR